MYVVGHDAPAYQLVSLTVEMFESVLHNGGNPFVPQETLTIASVFVFCNLLAEPLVLGAVIGVVIFVDVQLQFDLLYHLFGKRVVKAESDAL